MQEQGWSRNMVADDEGSGLNHILKRARQVYPDAQSICQKIFLPSDKKVKVGGSGIAADNAHR
jgi:hypothetical protein